MLVRERPVGADLYDAGSLTLDIYEILVEMLVLAWSPALKFRVSFGKADSLHELLVKISNTETDEAFITEAREGEIRKKVKAWVKANGKDELEFLLRYVPYRFLSVLYEDTLKGVSDGKKNSIIHELSLSKPVFYRLIGDITGRLTGIEVVGAFARYLQQHPLIIEGWIKFKLLEFLQMRNPNIPSLISKIEFLTTRPSLSAERKLWDAFLAGRKCNDIYCALEVDPERYELDHYIPWSFVQHHQLWNLIPATREMNNAKRDRLPDWDKTFASFAKTQYEFHQWCSAGNHDTRFIEDYLTVFPQDCPANESAFTEQLERHLHPLYQIAENSGFGKFA